MGSGINRAWPPGPSEPASEQVRRWIESPVDFWEACERTYGPVVGLDLGSLGPVVLLADADAVRELFQLPSDAFECRQYNEHYRYVMGDNAVLLQDGASHMRQRRLLAPPLRADALAPSAAVIRDVAERTVARWPVDDAFNPRPALHEIGFQVVLHLVFGELASHTSRALLEIYRDAVAGQVGSWGPWRNFMRLQPRIRALLAHEIAARRADASRPGLLTRVAQGRTPDGAPVSDAECEDHVFSMMIAGVDTAAVAVAWALHWVGRDAAVRDRLCAELAGIDVAGGALRALPYLHAVYCETLRMYPIVPTPSGRRLTRPQTIGGRAYDAGTTLVPCSYLVHRNASLYPSPHAFAPERFLARRYARHEYFPFGGGVRLCAGESLAELEFAVVLATILQRFDLSADADVALRPVRHGTLLAPAEHFRVRVRPAAPRVSGALADVPRASRVPS
ncbi:MAG: cytochrome P450 [Gemmatirosa sp.]|nr:cytochrome P450 [Gemmatirosa sp.]